jgi:hypothetical protein
MPNALLKVVFLWTVNDANRKGLSATAKQRWGIFLGTEMILPLCLSEHDMVFYAYQLWKIIEIGFSQNNLSLRVWSVRLDFLLPPKQPMCPFKSISHVCCTILPILVDFWI